MGSIITQDVFQRKLNSIFLDVPGVTRIVDDMIIYGRDDQEYDGNLNFLEVCRNNNLTLNAEKMQFKLPKVSFFGHTWSDKGLSPDLKKIEAVEKNGNASRHGNNEKFPRTDQLSQQIQPTFI